jgi:hypothetical protein
MRSGTVQGAEDLLHWHRGERSPLAIAGIWLWLLMVPVSTFGLCLLSGVWLAGSSYRISVGQLPGCRSSLHGCACVSGGVDRLPCLDDLRHAHRTRSTASR